MPKITKEMVLKGADLKVDVPADEYGEGFVFVVGSPDIGDLAEAKAIRIEQLKVKEGVKLDVEELFKGGKIDLSLLDLGSAQRGMDAAKMFLVARALSKGMGEEWTVEDVKKIKKQAVFNRIWKTVDSLTGFSKEAEETIKGFRRARKGKK